MQFLAKFCELRPRPNKAGFGGKMKKKSHGGSRPGAGRPSTNGPTRTLTLRIPEEDIYALKSAGIDNLNRFYVDAGKEKIARMEANNELTG